MNLTRTFVNRSMAAILLLAFFVPASAMASASNCPPLASKVLTAKTAVSTTSTSYVNVPTTNINFVQGGTKPGCVLVSFSAEAFTAANESMTVRPLLDGATACEPSDTGFAQSNTATPAAAFTRGMTFICAKVAPGSHSVRMQYFSFGGASVSLQNRTMVVQFVP